MDKMPAGNHSSHSRNNTGSDGACSRCHNDWLTPAEIWHNSHLHAREKAGDGTYMPMLAWGQMYNLPPAARLQSYTLYLPRHIQDLQGLYPDGGLGAMALVFLCNACGNVTILERDDPFGEIPGLREYTEDCLLMLA